MDNPLKAHGGNLVQSSIAGRNILELVFVSVSGCLGYKERT